MRSRNLLPILLILPLVAPAFERTEQREPCADYREHRRPLFGDLHVHSRYSFDSYVSSQRNDPWDAYRYAKGEAITLPDADGRPTVKAQLRRPLDFAAVTDHAEFLGPIHVCTEDAGRLGYWFPYCAMTRSNSMIVQMLAANYWVNLGVASQEKRRSFACRLSDCDAGEADYWQRIQRAAEDHYDRSANCEFTTFVGYEYTDAPDFNNLHRNVIFRNENVTARPISTYDTGEYNFPELWHQLRKQCIDGQANCDVMAIPHNSNLAGGLMFRDPRSETELNDRRFFEPLVELVQHKGASECRFDRLAGRGVDTADELCSFEQIEADNLSMLGTVFGEVRSEDAEYVPVDEFHPRNMVRNVLKAGLAHERKNGANPFRLGFIGSTDTHSATPGGADEDDYLGHLGRRDAGYRNIQDHFFDNPGGHAVVWAEENSRDAIFAALRRRETYATSGTRPVVRFFGGWEFEAGLCESAELVQTGYARGVPMGGDLPPGGDGAPRFVVTAVKDPEGNDLQRLQIVKGWVDDKGETHERVFEVAGTADNGADVDPESCAPRGPGFTSLCTVWQDPAFDKGQHAFYYARVIENPSCRWSTLQCRAAGVNPFAEDCRAQAAAATRHAKEKLGAWGDDVYGKCCLNAAEQPFYSPVIQERAWTSPIWYTP